MKDYPLDFPGDKFYILAQEYVQLVTPIVREHERLIDQLRTEANPSLTRRAVEAISKASNAVIVYEGLLRELRGGTS
jgi:hypothetical protein